MMTAGAVASRQLSSIEIARLSREICQLFPAMPDTWAGQFSDPVGTVMPRRIAFDVALVRGRIPDDARVVDLGGGMGIFATAMTATGARAVVVDDFFEFQGKPIWNELNEIWGRYGVQAESRNVLEDDLRDDLRDADAITAFHIIEHLHNSPRKLLQDCADCLKPGGVLVIAVPNAANLRKRLTVPFGGPATDFAVWYEEPIFRGHVREPVAADLVAIAEDIGLVPEILGRNFLGLSSPRPMRRYALNVVGRLLERRPSLCSDLYLVATKPG